MGQVSQSASREGGAAGADARALPRLDGVGGGFDFVFSCPPYYDLERYSDDPKDLSGATTYEEFLVGYRAIIRAALAKLKPDRFCAFVVGEIRDPSTGFCRNFVGDTIHAFQECGARLYNSVRDATPTLSPSPIPARCRHLPLPPIRLPPPMRMPLALSATAQPTRPKSFTIGGGLALLPRPS